MKRIENLTAKAYNGIKLLIYNQQLIPGQKILYEELARGLEMSRTPVINALARLEQEGYVILEDNRGYFVAKISLKEAQDILDTRELIETYCLAEAIKKLRDNYREEKIKELDNALEVYAAYKPEVYDKKRLFLNADFHLAIAKMAENQIMFGILRQLFERFCLRYHLESRLGLGRERYGQVESEHRDLLRAVIEKNTDQAISILRAHYEGARFYLLKNFEMDMHKSEEPFLLQTA